MAMPMMAAPFSAHGAPTVTSAGAGGGGGGDPTRHLPVYPWVTTVAGCGRRGFADGHRLGEAYLDEPCDLCLLPDGTVLIADGRNNCMRRLDLEGDTVTTVSTSPFLGPRSPLLIDNGAGVLVCDSGHHKVRMLQWMRGDDGPTPSHAWSMGAGVTNCVVAGTGRAGWADGPAEVAQFHRPTGLASLPDGSIVIADAGNHVIRHLAARPGKSGLFVSTIAGCAGAPGWVDGNGRAARFNNPLSLAVDEHGVVLVADAGNAAVRALHPPSSSSTTTTTGWAVTTVAGGWGPGFEDGPCDAGAAFRQPVRVAVGGNGEILVVDAGNACLRALVQEDHPPPPPSTTRLPPIMLTTVPRVTGSATARPFACLTLGRGSPADATSQAGVDTTAPGTRIMAVITPDTWAAQPCDEGTALPLTALAHAWTGGGATSPPWATTLSAYLPSSPHPTDEVHVIMHDDPTAVAATHGRYNRVITVAGPTPAMAKAAVSGGGSGPSLARSRSVSTGPARPAIGSTTTEAGAALVKAAGLSSLAHKANAAANAAALAGVVRQWERYADGGSVTDARFRRPAGLCVMPQAGGSVLIADSGNHYIRLLVSQAAINQRPLPLQLRSILTPSLLTRGQDAIMAARVAYAAAWAQAGGMTNVAAVVRANTAPVAMGPGVTVRLASPRRQPGRGVGSMTLPAHGADWRSGDGRDGEDEVRAVPRLASPTLPSRFGAHMNAAKTGGCTPAGSHAAVAARAALAQSLSTCAMGALSLDETGWKMAGVPPPPPHELSYGVAFGATVSSHARLPSPQPRQPPVSHTISTRREPDIPVHLTSKYVAAAAPFTPHPSGRGRTTTTTRHLPTSPTAASNPGRGYMPPSPTVTASLTAVAGSGRANSAPHHHPASTAPPGHPAQRTRVPGRGSDASPPRGGSDASPMGRGGGGPGGHRYRGTTSQPQPAAATHGHASGKPRGASRSPLPHPGAPRIHGGSPASPNRRRGGKVVSHAPPTTARATPHASLSPVVPAAHRQSRMATPSVTTATRRPGIRGSGGRPGLEDWGLEVGAPGAVTLTASTVSHASATHRPASTPPTVQRGGVPPQKRFIEELRSSGSKGGAGGAAAHPHHSSSRDLIALEEATAAGDVVTAMLLGDAVAAPRRAGDRAGGPRVTTADPRLITARYARHTLASAASLRSSGRPVVRNAPAFVNVATVVAKRTDALMERASVPPVAPPLPPTSQPSPSTPAADSRHGGVNALPAARRASLVEAPTGSMGGGRMGMWLSSDPATAISVPAAVTVVPAAGMSHPSPDAGVVIADDAELLEMLRSTLPPDTMHEVAAALAAYNHATVPRVDHHDHADYAAEAGGVGEGGEAEGSEGPLGGMLAPEDALFIQSVLAGGHGSDMDACGLNGVATDAGGVAPCMHDNHNTGPAASAIHPPTMTSTGPAAVARAGEAHVHRVGDGHDIVTSILDSVVGGKGRGHPHKKGRAKGKGRK